MNNDDNRLPVELDLLEEGRFMNRLNRQLQRLARRFIKYVQEHPGDADGVKAKLTIEVSIANDYIKDTSYPQYTVRTDCKETFPAEPTVVTLLKEQAASDGQPMLFVRASGSDASPVEQRKLCTDEGRTIDQASGKAVDHIGPGGEVLPGPGPK